MMKVPGEDVYDQFVDDGGNSILLDHKGKKVEETLAENGSLSDLAYNDNAEFECIPQLLMDPTPAEKTKYSRMKTKSNDANVAFAKEFCHKVEGECQKICDVILGVSDGNLIYKASNGEPRVFYRKLMAEYYR